MRRLPILTERVLAETKVLQQQTGVVFEQELRKKERFVSCQQGCSSCCHHPFLITVAEGVLLYRYLVENRLWSLALKRSVETVRNQTSGLSFEVWLMSAIACPMLDQVTRRCIAHEARPLHCRVTFSTGDPTLCHPHRLGAGTPLVSNADTVVQFSLEVRSKLKRLGVQGALMPLSEALLLGEAIDSGKLDIKDSDLQYLRDQHGT